jgi:hypothetical protein
MMCAMGELDRRVAALARGQHSLVTIAQLRDLGLSHRQIDYRVSQRRLEPLFGGVYTMPGVRPYFEQRALAACLATGGFASHGTAARLFHLRGCRSDQVHVTVERGRAPSLPGVTCHRTAGLSAATIGVIPVTMPAQTLLDLGGAAPGLAEGALSDALLRGLVSLPGMVSFLGERARSGRPGSRLLRELVAAHVRGRRPTESWLEDRLVEFLRVWGFPEPERQYPLHLPGRSKPIRFDCAYPRCRGAVEADGRLWHSSPAERRRDDDRDRATAELGWTTVRVTWLELIESPAQVAARIRQLLASSRAA